MEKTKVGCGNRMVLTKALDDADNKRMNNDCGVWKVFELYFLNDRNVNNKKKLVKWNAIGNNWQVITNDCITYNSFIIIIKNLL